MTLNSVSPVLAADAQRCIARQLGLPSWMECFDRGPEFALDTSRQQYNSTLLLKQVVRQIPEGAQRVLALIEGDLFIPMLSFVFGQAQVDGPGALVSPTRLRQDFYRLPPDPELLSARFRKEVLHELGHTLSLVHCTDPACVMSLATSIRLVDAKSETYCDSCRRVVQEKVRLLASGPMEQTT